MPRQKRADRSSVKDTLFISVRVPAHRLAALDAAVARVSQRFNRDVNRSEFMLSAVFRAVEQEGVSLDAPLITLPLPFEDSATLLLPFDAPAPAVPPSLPHPVAPAPDEQASRVLGPKKRRSKPSLEGVDVVRLPPRQPPRP
jgi:hypothetical protein